MIVLVLLHYIFLVLMGQGDRELEILLWIAVLPCDSLCCRKVTVDQIIEVGIAWF